MPNSTGPIKIACNVGPTLMHLFKIKLLTMSYKTCSPGSEGGEICQERWSRESVGERERERERANGKRGGALSRGRGIARGQQQGIRGRPSPVQGEPSLCVGSNERIEQVFGYFLLG